MSRDSHELFRSCMFEHPLCIRIPDEPASFGGPFIVPDDLTELHEVLFPRHDLIGSSEALLVIP